MLVGSWQKLQNYTVSLSINGKVLACVTSTRYLGVIVDQHLTWKLHVNYVLKRIRCKLYALNRARLYIVSVISIFCLAHFRLF